MKVRVLSLLAGYMLWYKEAIWVGPSARLAWLRATTQGVAMGLNQLAFQAVRNNGLKAQLNSTRGNASGVWRGNTHRYRTIASCGAYLRSATTAQLTTLIYNSL